MAERITHPRASPCMPVRTAHKHTALVYSAVRTGASGHAAGLCCDICWPLFGQITRNNLFFSLKIMQKVSNLYDFIFGSCLVDDLCP